MSRFNTLYLGEPMDAADELDRAEVSMDDLRIALTNALTRIHHLEKQVANLREPVRQGGLCDDRGRL